jgi:PKD repeat protein
VITQWSWNFGDTDMTTGVRPVHVYGLPGFYTVTLTVTDNHGQSAKGTTEISVVPVGEGSMDAGPADAGLPEDAGFDAGIESDAGLPPDAGSPLDAGAPEDAGMDAGEPVDAGATCGSVAAIEGGHWTYALTTSSPRPRCGSFHAGPLVITVANPTAATSSMTIKEAGTVLYTGTYTSATMAFSATNNDGLGDTQTLEGTFDATFTTFTGNYVFNSTVLSCMEMLDIAGMCG